MKQSFHFLSVAFPEAEKTFQRSGFAKGVYVQQHRILLCLLLSVVLISRSYATDCRMLVIHNTHAREDPSSVLRQGETLESVTEYVIDDKSGVPAFCQHGGYCYLALATVDGKQAETLKDINCQVDIASKSDESGETSYDVKPVPARAQNRPAPQENVTGVQGVKGYCDRDSRTGSGPAQADLKSVELGFSCNAAAISFLDNVNKRIAIRFFDAERRTKGPVLGFIGSMQEDGKTLTVNSFEFINAARDAVKAGTDSGCVIETSGSNLKSIACVGYYVAGGYKHFAYVNFVASADQ